MKSWATPMLVVALTVGAAACLRRARRVTRTERLARAAGLTSAPGEAGRWRSWGPVPTRLRTVATGVCLGAGGGLVGFLLVGPMGGVVGGAAGVGVPMVRRRGGQRRRQEALERQLAEMAESASLALRGGLSVAQAMEFAQAEALDPLRNYLDRLVEEQRLGVPFEVALHRLGEELDTDDARFLVMVTGIHARSGGDLAGSLEEVARTIRHRCAVRREVRAATAQGRVSGAIMGALPIAFLLFMSVTSHHRLAPVYRSTAGMVMIGAGLSMEGLAYVWIRRLLRIEV